VRRWLVLSLQALRLRAAPLVRLLTERYRPSLNTDPGLLLLLNKAASIYVRSPGRPGGPLGGLLGDLMKGMDMNMMLMSDEDEDEDL